MPDRHWFKTEDETLLFEFLMMLWELLHLHWEQHRAAVLPTASCTKRLLANQLWEVWVWIQALHGSFPPPFVLPCKPCVPKPAISSWWVVGRELQLLHVPGGCAGTSWQLFTPGAFPEIPGICCGSRRKHQFYVLFSTQCFSNYSALPTKCFWPNSHHLIK